MHRPISEINVPVWLLLNNSAVSLKLQRQPFGFIKKTLAGLAAVFENDFYCEKMAAKNGFLQRVDARVKLLTLLFFIVFSACSKSMLTLILLAFLAVSYAALSGIDVRVFIKRVWFYIPALVLLISLPSATSLFIRGVPLFYVNKGAGLYFSAAGLSAVVKIALRTGISLSFGYLLIISTRWQFLMRALTALRVPHIFVAILSMSYRYIFILAQTATDMMHARMLRTVGRLDAGANRRFFGRSIGFLFLKTSRMSDEIYDAMCCRGYSGENLSLAAFKLTSVDILFIINNIIILLILFLGELLF